MEQSKKLRESRPVSEELSIAGGASRSLAFKVEKKFLAPPPRLFGLMFFAPPNAMGSKIVRNSRTGEINTPQPFPAWGRKTRAEHESSFREFRLDFG